MSSALSPDPLPKENLNPEQQRAVDHDDGHLLIIAGAGTGKTKTLTARVGRLIEDGVPPERILLLTFTRRAAAEMMSRIGGTTDPQLAQRVQGGTFHAIANRILRRYAKQTGIPPNFTVLDPADAADLFGLLRTEAGLGEQARRFPKKETIANIYSHLVNAQTRLTKVLEKEFPWCAEHEPTLKELFGQYTERKRKYQVLDYDDLLLFWRALTDGPVGRQLRNDFDHILVDEYQDTNAIQTAILKGMSRTGSKPTAVCAVGDDAQAIYGFRAASVANLWSFPDDFPGTTKVTLEQNYRSTQPILDVANRVAAFEIANGTDEPLTASRYPKTLWSDRPGGMRPRLVTADDDLDEARRVADAVLHDRELGIDLHEQAVLFRTGHNSNTLEVELLRRDIPFIKFGGIDYMGTAHVKDLLSLLRVLDNPTDVLAWHRVLNSLEGIGPKRLRELNHELGLDADDTRPLALERFLSAEFRPPARAAQQVALLQDAWGSCGSDDLPAAQIDHLLGFCAATFPKKYENAKARLNDLGRLSETAAAYQSRSRFLTELTLDQPSKSSELAGDPYKDDDWLTLSTIHSAKGMEWRSVHLIHASDGNLPSDMALGSAENLAEELRLTYVALTRAKDQLSVSAPLRFPVNKQSHSDNHVYGQLSRFVESASDLFDVGVNPDSDNDSTAGDDTSDHGDGSFAVVAEQVNADLQRLWEE